MGVLSRLGTVACVACLCWCSSRLRCPLFAGGTLESNVRNVQRVCFVYAEGALEDSRLAPAFKKQEAASGMFITVADSSERDPEVGSFTAV